MKVYLPPPRSVKVPLPTLSFAAEPFRLETRAPVVALKILIDPALAATVESAAEATKIRFNEVDVVLLTSSFTRLLPKLRLAATVSVKLNTDTPEIALTISMFFGSNNTCPLLPCMADTSMVPAWTKLW